MIDSSNNKKEELDVKELSSLASEATSKASKRVRNNSETVLVVKNGHLIQENKNGEIKIIRKIVSREVKPGTKFLINIE